MQRNRSPGLEGGPYGTSHRGSVASHAGGSIRWNSNTINSPSEASALLDASGEFSVNHQPGEYRVRRRPSVTSRVNSITQVGGVNSMENFARSWTRAAAFIDVTPNQSSFILQDEWESQREEIPCRERDDQDTSVLIRASMIQRTTGTMECSENSGQSNNLQENRSAPQDVRRYDSRRPRSDLDVYPGSFRGSNSASLAQQNSSQIGNHESSYDAIRSSHRSALISDLMNKRRQQASEIQDPIHVGINEREPLLLREVEQDGKMVMVVAGQSTLPQTIFNSTNVLIGIGILSLPLGFRYSGWIFGFLILSSAALITSFTAKLLAKCMDVDPSLITFADIAFIAYGPRARTVTSMLFTLELIAACVGSIVLFADTLDYLIPGIGVLGWKLLCGLILIPLNFFPLRILSFSSFIGIFCCCCIVLITIINGLIKPHSPGSLREPARTHLFPENWLTLPLSFGLFMAPWGGHAVFPNIYRDMRHPKKYHRAVKVTFTFTYLINLSAAIAGTLMFGDAVSNEISSDIINTTGYPRILSIIVSIAIAIIPITKIPLSCNPITSIAENLTGIRFDAKPEPKSDSSISPLTRELLRVSLRVSVIVVFVTISIIFPSFDSIMVFMGSALCLTACVILPVVFYLKLFGRDIGTKEKVAYYVLVTVSSILGIAGTLSAFIPKHLLGA